MVSSVRWNDELEPRLDPACAGMTLKCRALPPGVRRMTIKRRALDRHERRIAEQVRSALDRRVNALADKTAPRQGANAK
jgi:hypothetical protein